MVTRAAPSYLLFLMCAMPAPLLAAPIADSVSAPAPARGLGGAITDPSGAVLEGVLVLLTPVPPSEPVRTSITGRDGRYSFANVASGTFRISAIKQGYETSIASTATWMRDRLDLILVPAGQTGPRPVSPDWILAVPKRDILRETNASPAGAIAVTGTAFPSGGASSGTLPTGGDALPAAAPVSLAPADGRAASSFFRALNGEVVQSFSETGGAGSSESAAAGGSGMSTSLAVGSPIGPRIRWNLFGQRGREVTEWRDARIVGLEANGQSLRVGLRYDTGTVGQLDMRAYYDKDSLLYDPAPAQAWSRFESELERRTWGYDADWNGRLSSDADLQVDVRYLGSALGGTGQRRAMAQAGELPDEIDAETNILKTGARLSQRVGADHQVHVDVKARMSSFGGVRDIRIAPSAGQDPALISDLGRDGWTVSVNAGESWKVLDPLALDFGFDVSRSVDAQSQVRQALIPQAGVTLTPGPATTIRGVVSYVAIDHDFESQNIGAPNSRAAAETIGLRLRIERALGTHVTLVLDAESQPFSYQPIGARWGSATAAPAGSGLYLSDEAASLREMNFALEAHPTQRTTFGIGTSAGRVQGQVAASIPNRDFTETLADSTLSYFVTHFTGRFERTGTSVLLDLTALDQTPIAGSRSDAYSDRRIDLRVYQTLRFVRLGETGWSLVVAYSSYVPMGGPETQSVDWNPALRAAVSRLSGGVSVRF